jgi:hypothetical protein
MNMAEEKWTAVQQQPQQQQQSQVPPSPHHHPSMPSPINGMSSENFVPGYPYDSQSQLPVHEDNHTMYMQQPKQEGDTTQRNSAYQGYVSMSAPNTPTTSRPNSTQNPPPTPQSAPEPRKGGDNRPAFTTGSFHASPYPTGPVRKRRADPLGFPTDAGPFFTPTKQHYNLYSTDRSNSYKLRINSKVDRGFFLAENDWTCYRRNYFQISSAFSINGTTHPVAENETPCLLEIDGQYHTVTQFLLGITARVSNSDKKIELVQHTPKRDKGPQMVPVPKPIRVGGNLNLSSVGSNSNIVTFVRIQFKTATANNGKCRAAQQYYVILVDLYAQVESGENHRVATSTSAPLVVRGRSPGHYADNHDRYSPLAINPAFTNDRHMAYGPNGTPGVMPGDFSAAPFSPYSQYPPPPFPGYPPVNSQGSMLAIMPPNAPNTQTPPFHPQQSHQPSYMVPSISGESTETQNPELYNNPNMDPNNMVNGAHDQKMHNNQLDMHNMEVSAASGSSHSAFSSFESRQNANSNGSSSKPFMKIEIPQSSTLPEHPLTSPGYHSQEYVDGFQMYQHGHPANNASNHHGGYHSENEHHSNGYQSNGRQPASPNQRPRSENGTNGIKPSNNEEKNSTKSNSTTKSKSPPTKSANKTSANSTSPTTELSENLGQANYRMGSTEEA